MIFNVGAGNGGSVVYLTQAEYDALPDSKLTNNIEYRITDGDMGVATASNLSYDNSFSGLEAVTVQGAVDELSESLTTIHTVTVVTAGTSSESFGGYYGNARIENPDNKMILIHSCYSSGSTAKLGFAYPSSAYSIVVNSMKKDGEYVVNYLLL